MKKLLLITLISGSLFANVSACKGCHGADLAKTGIMGTSSKSIASMSKADFVSAIEGYKAGTYGGSKKALMKAQANMVKDPAAFADTLGLK
jgi:cytochrome c553